MGVWYGVGMDAFIRNRLNDRRFDSRPVAMESRPPVAWYEQPRATVTESDAVGLSVVRHNASAASYKPMSPKKKEAYSPKKKKHKKSEESATSDGSDSSPCWSDYERTPGTEEGTKGSCRPKGSKKKKKKDD